MFWMTVGPCRDDRRRFGCGRAARLGRGPWGGGTSVLVVCVQHKFNVWPNGGSPNLSDLKCRLSVSINFVVLIFEVFGESWSLVGYRCQ